MAVIRSREVAAKQGFFCTIPYGNAIGTKVNGRNRQGGRLSGVAVKRGSTVHPSPNYMTCLIYAHSHPKYSDSSTSYNIIRSKCISLQ